MTQIARLDRLLRRAVNGAAALLLLAVVLLGIAQVVSRYLLGTSLIFMSG